MVVRQRISAHCFFVSDPGAECVLVLIAGVSVQPENGGIGCLAPMDKLTLVAGLAYSPISVPYNRMSPMVLEGLSHRN